MCEACVRCWCDICGEMGGCVSMDVDCVGCYGEMPG